MVLGLDTTIAADVQGSIYNDLGELRKLPWVGIGFPMGSVAVILLIGKLYGTFEIKWLIIGSIVTFEAGSALCGAAPSSNALIVGRVIAGIGGAGIALTYISVFTTLRERAIYNALIGLAWGTGAILGPVIAGAFAGSKATWRWAFYINLPLAAATAPIYIWLFPRFNPQPEISTSHKLAQIDWVGAVLNAITFVLFMVVLTFSGSTWRWNTSGPIALWTMFGVTLISYALQQTFAIFTTPERRLFPVHFVKRRTLLLLYFATAASASAMAVGIYYVPLFFQFTKGDTALEAAVRLLPFITLFVFSVMFAGGLLPVFGRYAPWYFPAAVLMIVGGALMYRVTSTTPTGAIYGFEILIAVGVGLIFQTGYNVAAAKVDPVDVPASIGFINVAQIGSIAIALSISGALFQNLGYSYLREALAGHDFSEDVLRSALAGAESVVLNKEGPVVRSLAIEAIVQTIDKVYALVLAAGALTFVCACAMRWEKLKFESVG
ncbi:MAG: hypothetical protein M1838_001502 [Thelocarpon superellum]|nr:MAG: hypothetical protein M1838_001502 [Thelocarpon superellum]